MCVGLGLLANSLVDATVKTRAVFIGVSVAVVVYIVPAFFCGAVVGRGDTLAFVVAFGLTTNPTSLVVVVARAVFVSHSVAVLVGAVVADLSGLRTDASHTTSPLSVVLAGAGPFPAGAHIGATSLCVSGFASATFVGSSIAVVVEVVSAVLGGAVGGWFFTGALAVDLGGSADALAAV